MNTPEYIKERLRYGGRKGGSKTGVKKGFAHKDHNPSEAGKLGNKIRWERYRQAKQEEAKLRARQDGQPD